MQRGLARVISVTGASATTDEFVPAYVEDAYQLFWNGIRIGGSDDSSGKAPVVYSNRPQIFHLP